MPVYLGHVEEGELYSVQPTEQVRIATVESGDLYLEPDAIEQSPIRTTSTTSGASPAGSILGETVSLTIYPDSEEFNRPKAFSLSQALRYISEVFMIDAVPNPSLVNGNVMQFDATQTDLIKNLAKASIDINNNTGLNFCVVMDASVSQESLASLTNSIADATDKFLAIKPIEPPPPPQPQPQPQPQPKPKPQPGGYGYGYDYDYGYGYNGSDYEVISVPQPRKCMKVVGSMINPRTGQMVTFYDSCQRDDIARGLVP